MNFAAIPHAATNNAPAAPVVLPTLAPPVAAADVRSPTDRFRCEPYACVLSAAGCQSRRGAAGAQDGQWAKGARPGIAPLSADSAKTRPASSKPLFRTGDYGLCRGCHVGEQIANQLSN